ncbi:hypothetical protein LZ554_002655 [Drepanopeziza brunnea f. sp. 'monogermtubi']|nr:hypothetical protein LZ554_002655 [Drepanopeziza brunnea f. sp. 'monogermtubi']
MSPVGSPALNVTQYLGVQYAKLKNTFADAEIINYESIAAMENGKHGPSAVQPPNCCEKEFNIIQQSLPIPEFPQSATDCLNLNVTVPGQVGKTSALPVFVYIHGGGFALGSNAWPQYDLARIVQLSSDLNMPIIGININYRLGPFGFMTSEELRNNGYSANNGLRDQKTALQWVQKHIALFGGDPGRVTCIGESAGAVSCMHLIEMFGPERPFQQVVSMAGTPAMLRPFPAFVADSIYGTVVGILGLGHLSGKERVDAILKLSAAEILEKLPPGLPFMPVLDPTTLKNEVSFARILSGNGLSHCRDVALLIGNLDMDANVFDTLLAGKKEGALERFKAIVMEAIPDHASKLLAAYKIEDGMSDDAAWRSLMHFSSDINFQAPTEAYASVWPTTLYKYKLREPNPWDGPWKGYSTHILDVAFLFQNYNERLAAPQVDVAVQYATDVISFINFKAPFPSYDKETAYAKEYLSDHGKEQLMARGAGDGEMWPEMFAQIGLDTLSDIWGKFAAS